MKYVTAKNARKKTFSSWFFCNEKINNYQKWTHSERNIYKANTFAWIRQNLSQWNKSERGTEKKTAFGCFHFVWLKTGFFSLLRFVRSSLALSHSTHIIVFAFFVEFLKVMLVRSLILRRETFFFGFTGTYNLFCLHTHILMICIKLRRKELKSFSFYLFDSAGWDAGELV